MRFAIILMNIFCEQNQKSEPMLGAHVIKHIFASCGPNLQQIVAQISIHHVFFPTCNPPDHHHYKSVSHCHLRNFKVISKGRDLQNSSIAMYSQIVDYKIIYLQIPFTCGAYIYNITLICNVCMYIYLFRYTIALYVLKSNRVIFLHEIHESNQG